jgi:hypothetical protein
VREPVPAKTLDKSLSDAPKAQPLQPGQPIRVMPDLKESPDLTPTPEVPVTPDATKSNDTKNEQGAQPAEATSTHSESPQPVVREPVKPKVMEKPIDQAPKVKPMQPDEPIRVMPDLKEQGSRDSHPDHA